MDSKKNNKKDENGHINTNAHRTTTTTNQPHSSSSSHTKRSDESAPTNSNKSNKTNNININNLRKPHIIHNQSHSINSNSNIPNTNTQPNLNEEERKVPRDVRIAVIGNVDSGKSTMIGVLTSGENDDGRGSARSKILRHDHERGNGRTSCLSQHIMGFNNKKKPVYQPVSISATPKQKTAAWTHVFRTSKNIITFIDLAGHEKYFKTTICGLTGCFPDYAFIVVGANMGISKMTKEHIQVASALNLPLFVCITKIDICPEKILKHTINTLNNLLKKKYGKQCLLVRKKRDIKLINQTDSKLDKLCPVFCVSAVTGNNIDKLNYFLSQLMPRTPWKHKKEIYVIDEGGDGEESKENEHAIVKNGKVSDNNERNSHKEFENKNDGNSVDCDGNFGELEIDETFAVRGVGIVVSGTVTDGRIYPNQKLFLGPFGDCSFKEIVIRSVHMKRVNVNDARAGESCSVSFRFVKRKEVVDRVMIRKGMVAVSDENSKPSPVWGFTATILVLHHPTTINEGYQPVVHCGNIRQTATIMKMSKHRLRSGDQSLVDMKFLCHPEFMHSNRAIIIREGSTKCIGKVVALYPYYDVELSNFNEIEKNMNQNILFEQTPHSMTKDELHKLQSEMKKAKMKQKELKKEKKEKKKMLQNDDQNDDNVMDSVNVIDNNKK